MINIARLVAARRAVDGAAVADFEQVAAAALFLFAGPEDLADIFDDAGALGDLALGEQAKPRIGAAHLQVKVPRLVGSASHGHASSCPFECADVLQRKARASG